MQELINLLYLEVGGDYEAILDLPYWRFTSIITTLQKRNVIRSGKVWVEDKVPQSSRDMIERRKKQR